MSGGKENLSIEAVSSRRELRDFIRLPAVIYKGLPGFHPALDLDSRMLLDPRQSAFWKRGKACYWLARKDGVAVGRISAQVDTRQPHGIAEGAGMFGCLDAIDSRDVVLALIAAAQDWLRQQGCTHAYGPCTLDMNDQPGLLVEGASEEPMFLYPWNPPYLEGHVEAAGYARLHDLHSWRLGLAGAPLEEFAKARRLANKLPGLTIRLPTRRTFRHDLEILCDIYNDGWKDNWGFVALAPEDLSGLEQFMFWFLERLVFRIVELDGKPVGVMLLIPNVYEIIAGLAPAPSLAGWARLAWRAVFHRFRSGRIIILGVASHLRHKAPGAAVAVLLIDHLVKTQIRLKGEWVEAGWVLEENAALVPILNRFGFKKHKTFRLFGRSLPC